MWRITVQLGELKKFRHFFFDGYLPAAGRRRAEKKLGLIFLIISYSLMFKETRPNYKNACTRFQSLHDCSTARICFSFNNWNWHLLFFARVCIILACLSISTSRDLRNTHIVYVLREANTATPRCRAFSANYVLYICIYIEKFFIQFSFLKERRTEFVN